jgi:hypothetical protein
MIIKCDWALLRLRKDENMKEVFEFVFRPGTRKWRPQGRKEAFTSLRWSPGLFWYIEEGAKSCRKSFAELSERNLPPFLKPPYVPAKAPAEIPIEDWNSDESQGGQTLDLSKIDFDSAIPELAEPENLTESREPQVDPDSTGEPVPEQKNEEDPGKRHGHTEETHMDGSPMEASHEEQPREKKTSKTRPPSISTEEEEKRQWKVKGPSFKLTRGGKTLKCSSKPKLRGQRIRWVKGKFGAGSYECFDPEEKITIELSQCQEGKTYELRSKGPRQTPPPLPGRKFVTLLTELERRENVQVSDSDTAERRTAILRGKGIVGTCRFLIEGREIRWQDFQTGDVISVERITDASIWVKVGTAMK